MRTEVISKLICPECGQYPLSYEDFIPSDSAEILDGVVWCSDCGNWYPIEDGLLELLGSDLAYIENRIRFWATYEVRLMSLGLKPYTSVGTQRTTQAQRQQQKHSDFVADATRLPFVQESFDYVLVYGVLYHLPKPGDTCQQIACVLKPGGVYFGSENNQTIFRTIFDLLQHLRPLWYEEAGEHPLISEADLREWLQPAGLKVSVCTSVFLPPHLLNLFSPKFATQLLKISDKLLGSVPILRNQGGLIYVYAVKK